MKKLNEISSKLMQSYKTAAQARVKKLEADFKSGDRSMARATEIRKRDRNIITVGHKLAKRELVANTKAHAAANAGPKKPVARDSGSASDYYKFKKPGQYVGDSVEIKHDGEQIAELSKSTLGSYVKKAASDAAINRKIGGDFEHRAKRAKSSSMKDASNTLAADYRSKAWKRQDNLAKAVDRLTKEDVTKVTKDASGKVKSWISIGDWKKTDPKKNPEGKVHNLAGQALKKTKQMDKVTIGEADTMEPKLHPNALHVKPVKVNGQTKYKVHAVGSNFSNGIKKGEHLSDTELDDFSEMGGKIKHIKEHTLSAILDEARGRPRKNPVAAPAKKADSEDHEDDEGPVHADASGDGGDTHIQNQLKRAHDARDLKGGADVKFGNGKTHFIKSEHAHKVLTALEKIPKPSDRAEAAAHVYSSHDNFKAVHSMLK